ncbi:MAG TPA: hypothetical protein VFW34_04945 [Candidatus Rubrimentiphilum sp.]|nr:hypothetical protein [Candidatus Rubrimentiphilum sp.]
MGEGPVHRASPPKALLRFYAISAAVVFTAALIIAGYVNRDRFNLKIASVTASVPPKAAQADALARSRGRTLGIAAPWVLSALPECLRQTFEAVGNRAYVASKLPPGYVAQPAGTHLQFADCNLTVETDGVLVRRGADKYYVPPPAQLFKRASSIALMHEAGARAILRIYEPAPPGL